MKEHIQKAHEIKESATSKYRELLQKMNGEISEINNDFRLSPEGKQYLISDLKKEYKEELMKLAKQIKAEYQLELSKAKISAEKVLESPIKKPDENVIGKYREQVEELKTRVMLSLKPETAKDMVSEFVKGIDDPYLANEFKKEFATVITPIISNVHGAEGAKIKHALTETYDKLNKDFMTDEQREAKQIIESTGSMASAKVFNYTVLQSVSDSFGRDAAAIVNEPEKYFQDEN